MHEVILNSCVVGHCLVTLFLTTVEKRENACVGLSLCEGIESV